MNMSTYIRKTSKLSEGETFFQSASLHTADPERPIYTAENSRSSAISGLIFVATTLVIVGRGHLYTSGAEIGRGDK
jgi:hypothetical protein